MSIPGARGCKNCEMRFRFNDKVSLKQVLINIKQGRPVSPAILREVRCYILDKDNYPFKGECDE